MRIEDLKILVDVVRYHSMNIAAEKNFTTPQNLSKIIKKMEDELGVVLFTRSSKGSNLTEVGERFYFQILEALKYYDRALVEISENEWAPAAVQPAPPEKRKVSVLCTQGIMAYAIADIYENMKEKIRLDDDEIYFLNPESMPAYLEGGNFDIIACFVLQENMEALIRVLTDFVLVNVLFDEMVLVVSRENALSSRAIISTEELNKLPLIQFKDSSLLDDLVESDEKYHLVTNSHTKALEQIRRSDSYCALLSKNFVELYNKKFNSGDNLHMVRLEKKIYGTYVILVKKELVSDKLVMEFAKKIVEDFFGMNDYLN